MAALFAVTFGAANPLTAYGVFLPILAEEFGWSRGAISLALTINMVISGVVGLAVGAFVDRRGPRMPLAVTCVLAGGGFALVSQITALWHLHFYVGVMAGIGMSGFYVLASTTAARWFEAQRGLAIAIVLTGYSVGVMTGSPLAAALIGHFGWRIAYVVLGVGLLVIGGLASLVVTFPPSSDAASGAGVRPGPDLAAPETSRASSAADRIASPGAAPAARRPPATRDRRHDPRPDWPAGERAASTPRSQARRPVAGVDFKDALRDVRLWLFSVAWLLQGAVLTMLSVHVVSYARDQGISLELAAFAVTAYGVGSVVGRMLFGAAADRRGTLPIMRVCFAIQVVALAPLVFVSSAWALLGVIGLFGAGIIGADSVFAKVIADVFGVRAFGAIMGLLTLLWRAGAAAGPAFAGFVYDATGSYVIPFGAAPVAVLVSLALFTIAWRRHQP